MLEKAATLKRFEYSLLGTQFKNQTSVAEKQYQGSNKLFRPDGEIYHKSYLIYDIKYSFSEYRNFKEYSDLSFTTKHDKLILFYHWLNGFKNFPRQTVQTKIKTKSVYKNVANLRNKLHTIHVNDYKYITNKKEVKNE